MKRPRKLWLLAVLMVTAGLAALLVASSVPAKRMVSLRILKPTTYQSNGDSASGWHWLRNSANTAEWTFNVAELQEALRGQVYLNFHALVTKGQNGGSGYSGSLKITYVGNKTLYGSVSLVNRFRPQTQVDSGGVGYSTEGYALLPTSAYLGATALKVIVSRSSSSNSSNLHIAVSQDALSIGYVK